MKRQCLTGNWLVRQEPLSRESEAALDVTEAMDGWMSVKIPTDVRVPLIEAGRIQDPVEVLACFDSEWVEERSWWFKTTFDAEAEPSPPAWKDATREARKAVAKLSPDSICQRWVVIR